MHSRETEKSNSSPKYIKRIKKGFSFITKKEPKNFISDENEESPEKELGNMRFSHSSTKKKDFVYLEKVSSKKFQIKSSNNIDFPEGFFIFLRKEEKKRKLRTCSIAFSRKRLTKENCKKNKVTKQGSISMKSQISDSGTYLQKGISKLKDTFRKFLIIKEKMKKRKKIYKI
jgi:hypothetical protein